MCLLLFQKLLQISALSMSYQKEEYLRSDPHLIQINIPLGLTTLKRQEINSSPLKVGNLIWDFH